MKMKSAESYRQLYLNYDFQNCACLETDTRVRNFQSGKFSSRVKSKITVIHNSMTKIVILTRNTLLKVSYLSISIIPLHAKIKRC